jgi:hypothetical protein
MSKKSFVLNDETVINSRGFRVPNAKINLERFKKNAVLLYMHKRGEVHGRWENIRIEGTKLLADAVFDMDDPESAKIAGKVERGFLNGASLYLHFVNDTKFEEGADGNLELHNSEAWEGSIVDVPSNEDSIKLFADNKELNDEDVKGFMLAATPNHPDKQTTEDKSKTSKMEKFKLSAAAIVALAGIGLSANEGNEAEVNGLIEKMGAALSAEKTAHNLEKGQREKLENQIKEEKAVALSAMVDQAVTDGKILATAKDGFVALGFDSAKLIIDGLPGKTVLGNQINNAGAALSAEPKTMDEFEKLSTEDKLTFKNGNPTGYAALFA